MTHFFTTSTTKVYYEQPYSKESNSDSESDSFFSDKDIIATRNIFNKHQFLLHSKEKWERTSSLNKAAETQISISELGKNLKEYYSKNQFHLVEVDTRCKIDEHHKFRPFFNRLLSENNIEIPNRNCASEPCKMMKTIDADSDFMFVSPSPSSQDDSDEASLTQEDPIESSFPEPVESPSPTRSKDEGKEQEITQEEYDSL